jgi:hypothetical protein
MDAMHALLFVDEFDLKTGSAARFDACRGEGI